MVFPNPVEAVIFDMDGTLLDTEQLYLDAWIEAGRSFGVEMTQAVCHEMIGKPLVDCEVLLRRRFGAHFPFAQCLEACSDFVSRASSRTGIPLKAGAKELVEYLTTIDVPKAIATSSRRHATESHLERAGLLDHFAVLVTRDDVERGKPHPETYLEAARALGKPPERCLALEDSPTGLRAAAASGAMTILAPDILQPSGEDRALCLAIVSSLHEVLELLRRQETKTNAHRRAALATS